MFKNYLKVAIRNLLKYRLFSFINILGMGLAIGCSMVVFVFIDYSYNSDKFHEHAKEIYLVENVIDRSGRQRTWGDSPAPLGEALSTGYPQITQVVRVEDGNATVRNGDDKFSEWIRYVDPAFMDMFTFKLKWGDPMALEKPNQVIINEKMATKYFGEDNPVGQTLEFTFGDTLTEIYVIGGVAEEFPAKASFSFRFLLSIDKHIAHGWDATDWKKWVDATFIRVKPGTNMDQLIASMDPILEAQNAVNHKWSIKAFVFEPLLTMARHANETPGGISGGPPPAANISLLVIGIFLLLLASFNYINISIASASQRLKEIGIRKVVGGNRAQLIFQFLSENVILCFIALILGVLLGQYVFIPGFMHALGDGPELALEWGSNRVLWLYIPAMLLLTGVGAGLYPALYISSFQTVDIFRGKQKLASRNWFTRTLLTLQFVFAFILMVGGVIFTQNAAYQRDLDWGYGQEQVISVHLKNNDQFKAFRDKISQSPNVTEISGARNHINRSRYTTILNHENKEYEVATFKVGHNYVETIGLRSVAGRFFDHSFSTESQNVIINEKMLATLGQDDPNAVIAERIRLDSVWYNVVGVVEDFHYNSFWSEVRPVAMLLDDEETYPYLVAKVKAGTAIKTMDFVEAEFNTMFPSEVFSGQFQDEAFDGFFKEGEGIKNIFVVIAIVALLLSCMGLFGLVSLIITKRMKEFSVRKILGASMPHITRLVNKQFVVLLLIAMVIATPLSVVLLTALLDDIYEYRVPITALPYLFAAGLMLLTAVATVSSQLYKVVVNNPAETLRSE